MKLKTLTAAAAFFLLAGCGTNEESANPQKTKTPQAVNETASNEGKNGEPKKEAVQKEEPAEETALPLMPAYRLNTANWSLKPIAGQNPKVALLTIDDAPDKNSLQIAKTLKSLNVKAIFFVNGHFIDSEEEKLVLKQIDQMGFMIGNHTYNHKTLKELTDQEQYDEIVKLNDTVEQIIGKRPKFFRAPFGINTDYSRKVVADEKMLLMNWTYGYDWEKEYQNKAALENIMVNSPYLTSGANLLMHDRAWTSQAMPQIIKGLQAKGFEMLDPALIETTAN
ncbi:polysaccharide deacetylase family protein [Bacillus sp. M6-12]|uniref:polysaccharide deacetylase family protein n=1 Tax=Bacillus sp. M6-12 TaxID=2054166 RepID=UPI0021556283|nr:polysaccharide deacetylase family protein [Bacillus sp. M6-12]